ncbi:MAG TPA: sensor histidine kinase [Opitutus sp.]|nr:sensor histidine kinase [Opitutus sp.]
MNPLPRLLGLGLLVVLAALAAVLAVPLWTHAALPPAPPAAISTPPASRSAAQVTAVSHRIALPFALTALVLAVALFASLAFGRPLSGDAAPPAVARSEINALASLAAASNAQGEALARERGVRHRAEADALLTQQQLNRSLEEQIALGRDLHDGVIQSLYAAGLTIESARPLAVSDPAEADRRLAQCLEALNRTIRDIRAYIRGLSPENLRHAGFAGSLAALVDELGAGRSTQFELKIDEEATGLLSPGQQTEALQVVREAISNSLRHGGASRITVRLQPGERDVCLLVQDNGTGFDPASRTGTGHGLVNMQARASRLHADVRIESRPGEGTRVVFTLPLLQPT